MQRILVIGLWLFASSALAQATPDIPQEKVVVVPLAAEAAPAFDAGVAQPPPTPPSEPVPGMAPVDAPTAPPAETRTFEAVPPPPPASENLDPTPIALPPQGPGALIDGHPREGAFLSGPGSMTFLLHHTLMTGVGVFATQFVPRAIDASPAHPSIDGMATDGCITDGNGVPTMPRYSKSGTGSMNVSSCSDIVTGEGARLAYLTGTLLGAGIGFTSAAIWQFNNWISPRSANFGIITSFFGGAMLGSFADLVTSHRDPYATAWLTVIGNSLGAWLAAIIGGGDIALNKAALVVSGGAWAAVYTALIVAIMATSGGAITPRSGMDAILLTPAIGAGLMALATLKFNPSFGQVMRANLFGAIVGGAVLAISGLLLGPTTGFTSSPLPYILAGVGAIGAKTLVSFLWADAAESPAMAPEGQGATSRYRSLW